MTKRKGLSTARGSAARVSLRALAAALLPLTQLVSPAAAQPSAAANLSLIQFDLPEQSLSASLADYARLTHANVLFDYDRLSRLRAPALNGQYSRQEALQRLLAPSGMVASFGEDGLIRLEDPARPQQMDAGDTEVPANESRAVDEAASADDEIVVTGTRIRGAAPVGSTVITIDRQAIEESGVATTEELMRTLPVPFAAEGAVGMERAR